MLAVRASLADTHLCIPFLALFKTLFTSAAAQVLPVLWSQTADRPLPPSCSRYSWKKPKLQSPRRLPDACRNRHIQSTRPVTLLFGPSFVLSNRPHPVFYLNSAALFIYIAPHPFFVFDFIAVLLHLAWRTPIHHPETFPLEDHGLLRFPFW